MLNGCHTSVQQLSSQTNKSQANIYDKRLSSNVVQATASALQDLTIKFRKCQSAYLHSKNNCDQCLYSHFVSSFCRIKISERKFQSYYA
jgi:hypothetical protein